MTSNRCFFRYMKEDMRHKVWMLALSALGNMLAVPVAYLLVVSNGREEATFESDLRAVGILHDLFCGELCAYAGTVAVIMALLAGFAGFRYLFHRNMVDAYHGMPVRRRTLFLVNWLDGLLIWFVPFMICMGITILLGEVRLRRLKAALPAIFRSEMLAPHQEAMLSGSVLFLEMLETAAAVLIAFLLVYHLVLVAVMLCGNVLNAICVASVLGSGVFSCFVMGIIFSQLYFDTFITTGLRGLEFSIYASPLFSSVLVIISRIMGREEMGQFAVSLLFELVIALALGIAAAFLYRRRPSELAEQGLKNKPVGCLIRTASSITAGMGGWLLFLLFTVEVGSGRNWDAVGWNVFGGVLASVIVYGVLDMIFHMDFRAFFAHKAAMAATAAVTIGVCFAFLFDWFGYDTWLPGQEQIAEISLSSHRYHNRSNNFYGNPEAEEHIFNHMHLTDRQAAYDFLQAAVRVQSGEVTGERKENFLVKVTLENGREYYRGYNIYNTEREETYALLISPEYQNEAYRISEEAMESFTGFSLKRSDKAQSEEQTPELLGEAQYRIVVREMCEAYNKDIQENPEVTIKGDGILLCEVSLYLGEGNNNRFYLDIYDTMGNTVEVLKRYGFSDFVKVCEGVEIAEITLRMRLAEELQGDELAKAAGEVYGAGPDNGRQMTRAEIGYESSIVITDPEEIAELLEIICYSERRTGAGIFYPGMAGFVDLTDKDGTTFPAYMPKGALPEKYILRFGETDD